MPLNAEETPLGCVDVIIYKSIGDVCFEKPQALACLLHEFNGIIDGGILDREGLRWIEAFNAGVRGRQIKKKKKRSIFSLPGVSMWLHLLGLWEIPGREKTEMDHNRPFVEGFL